jgi:hypothetical protein
VSYIGGLICVGVLSASGQLVCEGVVLAAVFVCVGGGLVLYIG